MSRSRTLYALYLLLPLAVDVPQASRDSSETRLSLTGGIGTFALVSRNCQGEVIEAHRIPFRDGAVSIEHKFDNPIQLGVRGGVVDHTGFRTRSVNSYVNPNLSFEWKYVGIGGGYFHAQDELPEAQEGSTFEAKASGHLRIGRLSSAYLSLEILEAAPLYSGGGYFVLGLGVAPNPRMRFYAGLSGGPYDAAGAALHGEFRVAPNLLAAVKARLGSSAGVSESAVAFGIKYAIPWTSRRAPPRPSAWPADSAGPSPIDAPLDSSRR